MLDVELQLVVFVCRQAVHQLDQRGQCRHFATRDIEHDSAMGHRRAIADVQRRDTGATRPQELLERLHAIEQARFSSGRDGDRLPAHVELVRLRMIVCGGGVSLRRASAAFRRVIAAFRRLIAADEQQLDARTGHAQLH